MIGAAERQKFVYIIQINQDKEIAISSPLEAHKHHTVTFDIVGIDQGWDNPMFAALEVQYSDPKERFTEPVKSVVFYEVELGVNHVTRKFKEEVDQSAISLIALPGGDDGPGGCLAVCHNCV